MASAANITRILLLVVLASSAYAVTDCIDINVSGAYVLENSITNTAALVCINITVSNVSLDGGGFTVDGTDAARSMGIYAYNSSQALTNITIGNITVTDFANGIELRTVQNSSVLDSTVASNLYSGLEANYSVGITLSGVRSENNSASGSFGGIHFNSVNSSSIMNSRWMGNLKYGILVWPGYDINITNNTGTHMGRTGISIWAVDRGVVSYNSMENCSWQGLDFYQLSNYSVFGNNVTTAGAYGSSGSGGIATTSGSRSNLFYENIVNNTLGYGFMVHGSTGDIFENNTVYNISGDGFKSGYVAAGQLITQNTYRNNLVYNCTRYGFNITNITNSLYENNVAYGNGNSGFYLGNLASGNSLLNNTAYNNNYGFYLTGSSNNNILANNLAYNNAFIAFTAQSGSGNHTFINNTISNNPGWGFFLYLSSNNTLMNNTIYNNSAYGLYLYTSSNNSIINNTILDNPGYGLAIEGSSNNNTLTSNTAYGNSNYSVFMSSDSIGNTFTNTLIYNQSYYILQQATAAQSNNFTNLTLGYNSTIGWINFALLNITNLYLNASNLKLDPYFVSLDDSSATQANLSANITILTGDCSYSIFRKAGFPLTKVDITANGTLFSPLSRSCSNNILTFDVGGFSGYSSGTGCVNISDPTTWRGIVNSSGVLYVNANTTLCTDTYYLSTATYALWMNASNIWLDCNQSVLDGVDGLGTAIVAPDMENDTIENCTITRYNSGVYLAGTNSSRAAFNNISQTGVGIDLSYGANRNRVLNNTILDSPSYAIRVGQSNDNYIYNNTGTNSGAQGFLIENSNNTHVLDNNVTNATYENILIRDGGYNEVAGNTVRDCQRYACLLIARETGGNVTNNVFAYNHGGAPIANIYLDTAPSTLVQGNQLLDGASGGIYAGTSNYLVITDNIIRNNSGIGAYLVDCNGSTLDNNTASGNGNGFYLYSSDGNVLSNNTAHSGSGFGFRADFSSGNNFTDSISYNNSEYGVYLVFYANNTLANTLIYNQTGYIYSAISSYSNFTNLTLGYNATVGIIRYQSLNVSTELTLVDGTNIYLRPDWVSLDGADADAADANVPAYITINNSNCATLGVLRATGFPASMAEILTNGVHYPTTKACNGNLATFNVSGFSGYTLGQETTNITFNATPSTPITFGTETNVSCNASNSVVALAIYRNGTAVAGPATGYLGFLANLSAGSYNFTCNTTGNGNYTNASSTILYTVNRNTTILTLTMPLHPTSGEEVNVSCDASNSEANISLYRDGANVANGTTHIEEVVALPAGSYTYICNTSGSGNYTNATVTGVLDGFQSTSSGSTLPMAITIEGDRTVGSPITITARGGSTPVSGVDVRVLYWFNGILNAIELGNTDANGRVEFTPTTAGEYRVEAAKSGYEDAEIRFTVEAASPEEEQVPAAVEEQPGEEPSTEPAPEGGQASGQGSTGGQPQGVPSGATTPGCTVNADCGSGFECQNSSCVETTAQPAAGGEETPAGGDAASVPQAQGVPWWAWLLILIILGGGAYWYFRMRKK